MGDGASSWLKLHWLPALNLGGSIQFGVADWIDVAPSVEYNHFLFDSFHQLIYAESHFLKGSAGGSSHALRLAIDVRFIDRSSATTSFYFFTGLGYIAQWFGEVTLTWSDPDSESRLAYDSEYSWVHTIGGGLQYRLSQRYSLDGSIKCFAKYHNPMDMSVNIGVSYQLGEVGLAP